MKKGIWIVICLIIGMVCSLFFFPNIAAYFQHDTPVYDDEQEGLKGQITIYFSHVVAENTPKGLAAQRFKELIEKKTNGRVHVVIFPNGSLYSDNDEVEALKKGKVQMIAPSYSKVADLVPEWEVLDLPFIFQNSRHVEKVLTGDTGKNLLGMLDAKGFKGLAFWGNGFKQMINQQTFVKEPKDFQNKKFRIMPNKVIQKQFRVLGANPVVASFDQIYELLEKDEFDGQENTISNIYSKSFYQFHPYLTMSNHGYLGYVVMVNQDFWNKIPNTIQKQIVDALNETTRWNMEQANRLNEEQYQQMLKNPHIHIHVLTEKERRQWMEKFSPLYEVYERKYPKLLTDIKKEAE